MSAYTTVKFTRDQAREYIKDKVDNMLDKELEEIMDIILDKQLNNCVIVPEGFTDE